MGLRSGAVRRSVLLGAAALTLVLASCGGAHDPVAGLTKEDYEALRARRPVADARPVEEPPIPDLQPILAAPQPPALADSRRVSIQAMEPTPVRDLLVEIARKGDIDLELDPRIDGGVIISARDRPIKDVVERLADLAGLRYDFTDNRLRVELDEPYLESYRVDALALKRNTTSSISSSTDVFSAVGDNPAGVGNASRTEVTTEADADLWKEISDNIDAIIQQRVPEARTVAAEAPALAAATGDSGAATGDSGAASGTSPGGAAGGATAPTPAAGATAATEVMAAAQQQAAAIPAAAAGGGSTSSGTVAGVAGDTAVTAEAEGNGHYYAINRQAGIVSVYTTQRQHKKISSYLEQVQRIAGAQVLIEAKIVEVNLNDEFRAGINWNALFTSGWANGFGLRTDLAVNDIVEQGVATAVMQGAGRIGNLDINGALNMISRFGTARTLSNPRLTVLNNQSAVLKVAENQVYFTIEIDREVSDDGPDVITYTSEIHTVPIGVILQVQPSIDLMTRQVSMNLRPTISRIVDRIENPAVELQVATIRAQTGADIEVTSPVPVVEVRELDSMVTMQSGEVLVLGGLMQERGENVDEGVPGVKDVPLLGAAFRKEQRQTEVVELVIFLRATIVNGRDTVFPADVELYNKFAPDPRPVAF